MKKSKKLKFITTLSSLGIIGATVPIATTSCSTSEKERSKYLDDFTYDDEDIPASQTLVLNGEGLTFYKQNFAAEYDSKEVEVKNVYIDANDNGRFLEFTRYQNVTHIQPKAINGSQTVILTFTVWDNEDHFLIKTTNIRIVAGNLHTIKYENKLIPGNKDVYIGSPLTLEDSKFSAKYLRQDVKIANVDIYAPQDTEQQYIKRTRIVDEQGKGSWKLTPLKATNAPINLWITVEDNQGHTGTVICSVTILSNVPKTLYYDDKDIPTDDLQVKTITETWYTNKFTAWNSKGEKLSIVSAEITSNDLGEHVKITTGVDEEKGAYNKLYTVKSTPDGYVEIYFDITFKDSENNRYYSHVTQKLTIADNKLSDIKYHGDDIASTLTLYEGDVQTFDKSAFSANFVKDGSVIPITGEAIQGVRIISSDTEQEYAKIVNNLDPEETEEYFQSSAIVAKQAMSNGGYVNLNIQISTINHEALLVGDVPVRLYIEPTWNTVGYKLDEHNIIAVQKSLGGKTREIKTGQVDEINDEVVATDTAAKSALDNWTKAEQTQTPENHKLILKPQKDISGNYVPYEFLDGEYALPNNIEIIGVMDDSGTVPTLTPYTLSVSTIENGNIGFAGVNFVATAATESSTELQKQGGTIVVQNDSKGNAAVLDSLSFLGCGFVNTNVYVHNKATVNKVITHQCTFVTSKQTRDWQYEVSAEGRKTYWYKWTSVLLEGDVESVSVSCNNFYGALYNAVQVSNGKKNLHKFNLSNNAFYDIENRVAHVVASKDTNDIVVSNNHIGKSCNLEPDLGGREDTTEKGGGWAAHINQLMYINSVGEKDMVLTEGQYLKFKLLSQNNTYDTEQSEITFDYISEEEIEPGQWSQVAFLATKPGSPF